MSVSSLAGCRTVDVIDRRLVFLPDITHEAKALSSGRSDQALLFSAVVDCLSCGVNPAGQGRLGDYSPAPYGRDEVIFADHALAVFNQVDQKIEDLRLDWHRRAMRTQFTALAVAHEIIEQKQHVAPPHQAAELYRAGRLKRNQDFLKDKSSEAQSLSCRKGAFQWPENEWSVECKRGMSIAEPGRPATSIDGIRRCSSGAPRPELNSFVLLNR